MIFLGLRFLLMELKINVIVLFSCVPFPWPPYNLVTWSFALWLQSISDHETTQNNNTLCSHSPSSLPNQIQGTVPSLSASEHSEHIPYPFLQHIQVILPTFPPSAHPRITPYSPSFSTFRHTPHSPSISKFRVYFQSILSRSVYSKHNVTTQPKLISLTFLWRNLFMHILLITSCKLHVLESTFLPPSQHITVHYIVTNCSFKLAVSCEQTHANNLQGPWKNLPCERHMMKGFGRKICRMCQTRLWE